MSNDTTTPGGDEQTTTTTTGDDADDETFDPGYPTSSGSSPFRTRGEEVMAHAFDGLSTKGVMFAFAAGCIIGGVAATWMINSITVSTAGLPQPLFQLAVILIGGVTMVGAEFLAALLSGYVMVLMGITIDRAL